MQRLAAAMAARFYNVRLGEFSMFDSTETRKVDSLAETIRMAADGGELDLGEVLPAGFDPDRSLKLGGDGGGMSYLGLTWSGDAIRFAVVEFEDPTEDNLVRFFATPAELLGFLDDKRGDGPPLPDLEALRAAAG